jgi:hypothetical protein
VLYVLSIPHAHYLAFYGVEAAQRTTRIENCQCIVSSADSTDKCFVAFPLNGLLQCVSIQYGRLLQEMIHTQQYSFFSFLVMCGDCVMGCCVGVWTTTNHRKLSSQAIIYIYCPHLRIAQSYLPVLQQFKRNYCPLSTTAW